ncbi:hypothetical protein R1flu_014776 [Riccia fluitans]|uniref:Glutaredoxin domain-containing protein n=1 Tax=Riccia fluitans TaxID=41844 RepID=A0ABD1YHG3_9MARC
MDRGTFASKTPRYRRPHDTSQLLVVVLPHSSSDKYGRASAQRGFQRGKKIVFTWPSLKEQNSVKMALAKAKELVADNSVIVFSKTYCPYCTKVKKLLTDLGAKFKAVELDKESDGSEIQTALAQWTGQRTVPSVFIKEKHIGGCDDTIAQNKAGKLVPLLEGAGAL